MKNNKTFFIQTFGCQMNMADSDAAALWLTSKGIIQTQNKEDADFIIINTCSVREHAEERAISYIGRLKPLKITNPELVIIMVGCSAELLGNTVKGRLPIIDLVIGAKSMPRFGDIFEENFGHLLANETPERNTELRVPTHQPSKIAAFLNIMRGCNNYCAYCVVPYVRGPEVSIDLPEILSEINRLAKNGVKEITLLGQNVNSYKGKDSNGKTIDFSDLLTQIHSIKEIKRIRFMSNHPKDFSDKLINTIGSLPKVCNHIHLPLQSASDSVLMAMNRNYTYEHYKEIINKLRKQKPDISLTTDIIIGFPGETENDFNATLNAIKELQFDLIYAFKYSPRKGTKSALLKETITREEKEARHKIFLEAANLTNEKKNAKLIGTKQEVLIETQKNSKAIGRTFSNIKVYVDSAQSAPQLIGKIVSVEITDSKVNTLSGIITS
ncbi:MAG: tRNA (N6-isopentenyl adenosine(37)-C2)-methylthiotransferase MiaB [Endomicrobiales bacterium]|nr:tRNA (N6-isopentenyl adenosine(37)-C2)-methylthiotransferase MiaB [Endomicrobiales bacterium]